MLYRSVQQGAGASTAPGMPSEQAQDPNPSMASFNTPPRGPMPTEMNMQSANKHDFREPFQDYSSVLTGKFIQGTAVMSSLVLTVRWSSVSELSSGLMLLVIRVLQKWYLLN